MQSAADRKQKLVTELRRGEILSAATKVFALKGFEATHMEDIAKAAGLAKGTLYLYFESKDAIYECAVEQALETLQSLTEQRVTEETSLAGKLEAFIAVRIAFWHEHQQLYRMVLTINRQEMHRKRSLSWQRRAVDHLKSIFEEAAAAGEIPEQDLLGAAWTTMDAIRGVNERKAFHGHPAGEEETRSLTRFLLGALRNA